MLINIIVVDTKMILHSFKYLFILLSFSEYIVVVDLQTDMTLIILIKVEPSNKQYGKVI